MGDASQYGQMDKSSTYSQDSMKKSTAWNRMVIVGCLVCVATTIIVVAIAVPLSKQSVHCDKCDEAEPCPPQKPTDPNDPPATTTTTPSPDEPTTTTTQPPPLPPFERRSTDAETSLGTVVGHEVDMDTGNPRDNVMSWLGVRFAKENPGRWMKPEPAEPIPDGRQVADHHRMMCPQGGGIFRLSGQQDAWGDNFGEDCLFLNIYAPVDKSQGPYPVMLYFYGGAYQSGGSLQYPGHILAQKGVVIVSTNYRLGIFGFASTADGYLKGNYGLWDQYESMRYVKNHIAAFGGDPDSVTIFGQSAGAGSIGAHMVSPYSKDLFDKALLQSGNEMSFWAFNSRLQEPEKHLPQVAEGLGCDTEGHTEEEWVECLRQVDQLTLRQNNNFNCYGFCLGMVPTIDGDYVPDHPWDMLNRGEFHDKTMMIGANTGECHLYVLGRWPWSLPEAAGFNRTQFQLEIAEVISWFGYLLHTDDFGIDEAYEYLNMYYSPWGQLEDKTLNKEIIGQMCTDGAWTANTAQVLKMRKDQGNAKLYQYTWGLSLNPIIPPLPPWLERGIPHQFEIPHIWGWPKIYFSDSKELKEDTFNLHLPIACFSEEDVKFTEFITDLWTNFAKYGDPTPTPIQHPFMDEPVKWNEYDNEDYNYFYFDNEVAGTYKRFRLREAAIFNEYLPKRGMGFFANPDQVQFEPFPEHLFDNHPFAKDGGKEVVGHNDVAKRQKRHAEMMGMMNNNEAAKAFRDAMTGDIYNDMFATNQSPILDIIREVLIPRLNQTLIENRNMTLREVVDQIVDTIRDTRCVRTTGYFWREVIEDNIEEIMEFLQDFFENWTPPPGLIPTLPPLPTLPPFPGRK